MKNLSFKPYYAIISLVVFVIYGCKNNEQPKKKELGEYVYIDQYKCIHADQVCFKLRFGGEEERPNYMVKRMPVNKLRNLNSTCSWCVNDEIYKELQSMIKNNETSDSLLIGW